MTRCTHTNNSTQETVQLDSIHLSFVANYLFPATRFRRRQYTETTTIIHFLWRMLLLVTVVQRRFQFLFSLQWRLLIECLWHALVNVNSYSALFRLRKPIVSQKPIYVLIVLFNTLNLLSKLFTTDLTWESYNKHYHPSNSKWKNFLLWLIGPNLMQFILFKTSRHWPSLS